MVFYIGGDKIQSSSELVNKAKEKEETISKETERNFYEKAFKTKLC